MSTWRFATEQHEEDEGGWFGLVTFIAACIGVGAGLWWFTGPPTMFTSVPDWTYIREVLGSSEVRDRDVITVTAGVAWIIIGYVLLTVALRLLFGAALALTGGAGWARAALQATSPLTIPVVRRMVDGALAGTIMVSATLHMPSAAFASSASMAAVVETRVPAQMLAFDSSTATPATPMPALETETLPETHTVVPGDNLWRIAERYLDDGFRWTEIWKLNRQRTMTGGRQFTDPNLIYPGWVLELPQGAIHPEPEATAEGEGLDGTPTPEPSPAPPSPSPTTAPLPPTAVPGGPVAPADDDGGSGRGLRPSLPPVPMPDAGAVAATAAITAGGAAMLLVFRRFRQRAGHTNGAHERRPAGSGDAARVLATATALTSALSDLDFAAARLLLVRESDRYLEFTIECPPGDADALAEARYTLGRRLGCAVDGAVVASTTVRLKLSRMNQLAAALLADAGGNRQPLLVPVGASDSGIYYLDLATAGSVLVAGGRLEARELLTSWFTTLDSLHPEGTVTVVADEAAWDPFGECMELLPSAAGGDLSAESPAAFARWLEAKLITRGDEPGCPALLAVMGPHREPDTAVAEMEGVLRQGPERGIFVIAFAEVIDGIDTQRSFGAVILFGEDEQSGAPGGITLTMGHLPPLHLEPVVVRRMVANRPRKDPGDSESVPHSPAPAANGHGSAAEVWPEHEREPSFGDDRPNLLDVAAPASTNGMHPAGSEAPAIEEVRRPLPDGMDRQASLPIDGLDGDEPGDDGGPPFRAKLFGRFRVETDAGEVDGWSIQKARELLAFLLAHGGAPVLRDTAAEALGLSGENQGGHPLPNAAYHARRALSRAVKDLEGEILVSARQRYVLRAGLFRTDVDAFDSHLARAERLHGYEALVEYQRALEICADDFLADEDYDWADTYRRDYQKRFITAAHRAARLAVDVRDPKLALGFYDAILQRDSIDEEAVRGAMRCHAAMGDRNSAKRLYKKLVGDLREALDDDEAEPMPETTKMLEALAGPQTATG